MYQRLLVGMRQNSSKRLKFKDNSIINTLLVHSYCRDYRDNVILAVRFYKPVKNHHSSKQNGDEFNLGLICLLTKVLLHEISE
jgi:hypothetical protein